MGIFSAVLKVVAAIFAAIAILLAFRILLTILGANEMNGIVSFIYGLADQFVGPFKDLFPRPNPKAGIAINYGIAMVVYLVLAGLCSTAAGRIPTGGGGKKAKAE